jgi:tetratricopeptide (TPR) repeat protein
LAPKGLFARPLADLALVYLYREEGKWKEGLAIAERLRKEYPNGLLLPQLISYYQQRLGLFEKSISSADIVLKSDPKNGPVHLLKGISFFCLSRLDEAEQECRICLKLGATNEYNSLAYYFLGEIAWKRGRYKEAKELWKKAAKLDPHNHAAKKALKRPAPSKKTK